MSAGILNLRVMMMPNNRYFDVKRNNEIIDDGGLFCHACLVGKREAEASPDPRYCQTCYVFLLKEAEMDSGRRGGDWKPKKATKQTAQVSQDVCGIMSTLESKKIEVDIIHPPATISRPSGKRGPKHRRLPEDLIKQLAGEGMGSKAIAARLKAELGITVSYKTIQRVLSGKRKQLALPINAP